MTTAMRSPVLVCLYPWLAMGGADKFNLDMLAQLRLHGVQTVVITTLAHSHPWRAEFEQVTDTIIDIGGLPLSEQPVRLRDTLQSLQPDWILISNSALGYGMLPALRAACPDAVFLDYNHMVDPYDAQGGYAGDSLAQAHLLDLQIVSSHPLRDWMLARAGDPLRIQVCTTNIDTNDWDPNRFDRAQLRAALGIAPDAFVGLFAARLEHVKRPPLAAALMRTVLQSSPNTCFLIAGDGSYTGFLRSYIRANRLDAGMRMLGAVSNSRIRELLALSDVLLLPSRMEGLSLAIYEAMAMGVVPISAAVGGQAELVTPDCGVLVLPGPTERQVYTEALLSLARDRERLAVMGQAARMRVRDHYRLDQMGQRIHNLLQEAHALHRAQPRTVPTLEQAAAAQAQVVQALGQVDDTAPTPARRARKVARHLYTMLIERGGWWLVPLVEKLRER